MQHLGWLLPQSNLRFASSLLEGAFWCVQPPPESCPRLRGKWTRTYVSGRKGNGSKMPSCLTVPPQLRLRSAAPPASGGAFWVQYKHGVQCRTPSRSDRFNGVTGVARGPKGRNRNLPWPPGKKSLLSRPWQQFPRSFAKIAQHKHERSGDEQPQSGNAGEQADLCVSAERKLNIYLRTFCQVCAEG